MENVGFQFLSLRQNNSYRVGIKAFLVKVCLFPEVVFDLSKLKIVTTLP
jgi:hypothetical protein